LAIRITGRVGLLAPPFCDIHLGPKSSLAVVGYAPDGADARLVFQMRPGSYIQILIALFGLGTMLVICRWPLG
jgi:hypothetical protein